MPNWEKWLGVDDKLGGRSFSFGVLTGAPGVQSIDLGSVLRHCRSVVIWIKCASYLRQETWGKDSAWCVSKEQMVGPIIGFRTHVIQHGMRELRYERSSCEEKGTPGLLD